MAKPISRLDAHCMTCGSTLRYLEEPQTHRCHYCREEFHALISCPEGHFVCDACHAAGSRELLLRLAPQVSSASPEEILEELLLLPDLPMHGPGHHPMAALALLLAASKAGFDLPEPMLIEAQRRCLQIPGGACGYHGACGAGVGVGVAVSLLTSSTPLKGRERGLANRATASALEGIGDGNPRCCKRALRQSVAQGRRFLARELGLLLPDAAAKAVCRDAGRNRECALSDCPYFSEGADDGRAVAG